MCLIAYQPENTPAFSDDVFRNAWGENPHGAGFMFVADGKLIVRKPFFKLKELRAAYAADHAAWGKLSPFVLHFRWATHGEKDELNTHPHLLCGGNVGLVHNGVLDDFRTAWDAPHSDTVQFCRTVMAYRVPAHAVDSVFRGILEEMIGPCNKLVLLSSDGVVSIVNESAGVWDGEYWFSNESYLPPRKITPAPASVSPSIGNSALPVRYQEHTQADLWEQIDTRGDEWDRMVENEAADLAVDTSLITAEYLETLEDAALSYLDAEILWDFLDDEEWTRLRNLLDEAWDNLTERYIAAKTNPVT